jgi:hypothetical protein
MKVCGEYPNLVKNRTEIAVTLREDLSRFMLLAAK